MCQNTTGPTGGLVRHRGARILGAMLVLGTATVDRDRCRARRGARAAARAAEPHAPRQRCWAGARYGGNALVHRGLGWHPRAVNYLGARHPRGSMSPPSSVSWSNLQILESLEPVHVTLFFTPGHYNRMQVNDLIQEYALRSPKLTYEFIDPDLEPRRAMEYQVSRDGVIIFERGERREFCFGTQEQDLTSALLRASSDRIKGVYFLTGHQERSIEESGERSLYQVAEVRGTRTIS